MIDRASLKLLVLMSLLVMGGVLAFYRREDDTIRRYTIERNPPRDRMLGAIIPRAEQAWFFKMSGPAAAVETQAVAFRKLIESVRFGPESNAQPSWTLPEGWTSRPGN